MKTSSSKLLVIVSVLLLATLIGMIFIRDKKIDTDFTSKTTNVGLLITGKKDDANFCQTHYDSLMNISYELNLNIICMDNIPEDMTCYDAMKDLIENKGCSVIVAASFGYGDYAVKMAQKHPEVYFIHPTGSESLLNMTSFFGRMYQARYLSGIVAGMRSGTGEIGYVAAFPNSEVICQINAFTLGVKSVAPDAVVHVAYCYSWVDDQAAETAGKTLFDRCPGIDVMTMHTNSLMPDRISADRGIWSIGFNKDNSSLFPDSYLTACIWKWDNYYKDIIGSCLKKKFYGKIECIDMENGIVGISELTKNCTEGTNEAVEKAKQLFNSRKFDVFYGPINDNKGIMHVPEGESMSDDEIMKHFDWYVEGVKVEE
ncbi:MAG: BMP family ABC transporter substrate-binding protein [Lachnospiraceae bacterium]|nr:BMP family ABC transporter substrate-binding protein [Lachnospiraceae bacterium]